MTLSMVLLIGASPFIGSTTGTRRRSRGLRADWCRAAESRRGRNIRPGSSGVQRVTRSSTAQRARGAGAAPPMLQTEKADVNVVLPEVAVDNLPTVGRNVSQLHLLAPGTSAFIFQQPAGENPSLGATVVANGQFWGSNEYQIDGITDVEFGSSGMQIITP